ncbi:MAG: hypothetical protein WCY49_02030 [Anaerovoracaceae bacterium]
MKEIRKLRFRYKAINKTTGRWESKGYTFKVMAMPKSLKEITCNRKRNKVKEKKTIRFFLVKTIPEKPTAIKAPYKRAV